MRHALIVIGLALMINATTSVGGGSGQPLDDPGKFSCEKWNSVRQTDRSPTNAFTEAVTAWVQGYFAGSADLAFLFVTRVPAGVQDDLRAGFVRMTTFQKADGIPKGLDDYCAEHPRDLMTMAAKRLLRKSYSVDQP